MAAEFKVENGNLRVTFTYIAPQAKMMEVAEDAAHYLWEHGYGDHGTEEEPILFDDLTNQQKLDLLDTHVRRVIIDVAKDYHVNNEQILARETASTYAEENISID